MAGDAQHRAVAAADPVGVRVFALFGRPAFLRAFHKWAAVVAFVASFLGLLIHAQNSIPVLYLLSCYAIVTGHWSSFQAAAVEQKQDEQDRKGKR